MAYAALNPAWFADAAPDPTHELELCSFDNQGLAMPMEVQVDVRPIAGLTGFPPRSLSFPGGSDTNAKLHSTCGFLRFDLTQDVQAGDLNSRVFYADLTSGRFALGAQVKGRVFASLWGGVAGISPEAQAWCGPTDGTADWLQYTIPLLGLAAAEVITGVRIPQCARYVDLKGIDGVIGVGTTAMKFRTSNRVLLSRDFQGGPAMVPGWSPEAIASFGTVALETLTVTNDSTAAGNGSLVFWVRG